MASLLIAVSFFILGIICCPLVIFIRARRDSHWDDSNMFNIYRIVAHLATHPSDFGEMVYQYTLRKPFWYINKDEFKEVVVSRKEDEYGQS